MGSVAVSRRACAALALMLATLHAWADEAEETAHRPTIVPPPVHGPSVLPEGAPRRFTRDLLLRPDGSLGIGVVELPPQGVLLGRTRAHHALSFASDKPRSFFRALGVDATDCATRLRIPGKLRQTSEGVQADLQAQVQLACRF